MSGARFAGIVLALAVIAAVWTTSSASANAGPFVVKYPDGDPAAKGVLARLDPDLKPAREHRLRVLREDLSITFGKDLIRHSEGAPDPPLAHVSAAYTIENPTDQEIDVDLGFPILRGIYVQPFFMVPKADVAVRLGDQPVEANVISNSAIYALIRQRARQAIDSAVAASDVLAALVRSVREAEGEDRETARAALAARLTGEMRWAERDAALMVEYASLDLGQTNAEEPGAGEAVRPADRSWLWRHGLGDLDRLVSENLGPLAAIGEQKATQLLAHLAARFDPETAAAYEAIFSAWGGDVRERSLDLDTGEVRPREITVDTEDKEALAVEGYRDPTIYARIDYFDDSAPISDAKKASCKAILRNLPVIFTFAPMNLLHYQVKFPAQATQTVTVEYKQYAYSDTREPKSYQLAYVVHPASLWDEFGPISLEVAMPEGVPVRASVPLESAGTDERADWRDPEQKTRVAVYRGTVEDKTGELFVAVDAAAWQQPLTPAQTAQKMSEYLQQASADGEPPRPLAGLAAAVGVGIAACMLVRGRRNGH